MLTFQSPWCLLALAIPILIRLVHWRRRPRPAAIAASSLDALRAARPSWRVRLRGLPMLLADLAFAALVVAIARPQYLLTTTRSDSASEGIAIEMVLDRSASMSQPMDFANARTTRLEAVKRIFSLFVFGDHKQLKGRDGDLVGLVSFAKTAQTDCPLTLSHDALTDALNAIVLVDPDNLNAVRKASRDGLDLNACLIATSKPSIYRAFADIYGPNHARRALENYLELGENTQTAIGDALALAIARLKQADAFATSYNIASKVLILLTDGENNYGRDVSSVIAHAQEAKVKVHVIAIGEARHLPQNDLPTLANKTGGSYTVADSADELLDIYRDIDAMERSELKDTAYVSSTEHFQPFVLAAFLLLLLSILLDTTLLRTLP